MTTMGMRVIRAGHDTPNTSNIASKKNPRGRRCGVSLRIHVRTAAKRLGSPTGRVCDARAQPRYVKEGQLQNIA